MREAGGIKQCDRKDEGRRGVARMKTSNFKNFNNVGL